MKITNLLLIIILMLLIKMALNNTEKSCDELSQAKTDQINLCNRDLQTCQAEFERFKEELIK